jgi:hypothetical protein
LRGAAYEKRIERITLTKSGPETKKPASVAEKMRERIVRRAACEFKHGMYANLGKNSKLGTVMGKFLLPTIYMYERVRYPHLCDCTKALRNFMFFKENLCLLPKLC